MHVLIKIAVLVLLALMLVQMSNQALLSFAIALLTLGLIADKQHLFMTLKRVRWLLLVMLCVYIFGTPGQYVDLPFTWLRPTYEGLTIGAAQVLKMVIMLAGLSLLLSTTSRAQLVSGLYQLMSLFSCLGIDAERFTSRLWLTLEYVEQQDKAPLTVQGFKDLFSQLSITNSQQNAQQDIIELTLQPLSLLDKLLFVMMVCFALWISWN